MERNLHPHAAGLDVSAREIVAAIPPEIGWDRNTIAKIEGRTRWVGDFELAYLAKAFKCQLGDLFSGEK